MVTASVALLLGLLAPALAGARESARAARCAAQLRQVAVIVRLYADDWRGRSPAIGQPYGALPNWALAVERAGGRIGEGPGDLYSTASALVCPSSRAVLRPDVTRTYAMNGAGHAGLPGDRDNYDDPAGITNPARRAHVDLDGIGAPVRAMLLVDSAPAVTDGLPPTRTASVVDLRQPEHAPRLGRVHAGGRGLNAARADGSVGAYEDTPSHWAEPLP